MMNDGNCTKCGKYAGDCICPDGVASGSHQRANQALKPMNKNEPIELERPAVSGAAPCSAFPPDTGDDSLCNVRRLRAEIKWLRGIIARNAMQRLKGEDATEMYVTANDIRDSLEILYTWQRTETPNDQIHPPRK